MLIEKCSKNGTDHEDEDVDDDLDLLQWPHETKNAL